VELTPVTTPTPLTLSIQQPVSSSTQLLPPTLQRPLTGTIISGEPPLPEAIGELILHNDDSSLDSVIALCVAGDNTARLSVYIRHGESYTFDAIDDGYYHVYFTFGSNWDPDKKQFGDNASYLEYQDLLSFTTTSSTNPKNLYLHYSVYEFSISSAMQNVNILTSSEFPSLK